MNNWQPIETLIRGTVSLRNLPRDKSDVLAAIAALDARKRDAK